MSSSSSSDSEDENIALLRQAVDTNFINDDLFSGATKSESTTKTIVPVQQLKSERHIDHDEIKADLNIPKSMQDFVYKKMSMKIANSIEFVEIKQKKDKKRKQNDDDSSSCCVRLLKDTDPITKIDVEFDAALESNKSTKLEVKRRIVEPDNLNDDEKIKMVAIDGEAILRQIDTKGWKAKKPKPHKIFNYREKKHKLHLIEPANEFAALRKKNNWDESKIANSPWKNYRKS